MLNNYPVVPKKKLPIFFSACIPILFIEFIHYDLFMYLHKRMISTYCMSFMSWTYFTT